MSDIIWLVKILLVAEQGMSWKKILQEVRQDISCRNPSKTWRNWATEEVVEMEGKEVEEILRKNVSP